MMAFKFLEPTTGGKTGVSKSEEITYTDEPLKQQNEGRILPCASLHGRSSLITQPCHIEFTKMPCESQWHIGFGPKT